MFCLLHIFIRNKNSLFWTYHPPWRCKSMSTYFSDFPVFFNGLFVWQLKDWFTLFIFLNSTEQLVEALLSSTSSLLKITGFIQEVISSKREWYLLTKDSWFFFMGKGVGIDVIHLDQFKGFFFPSQTYEADLLQAWGGTASYMLYCLWVHRWRCCFICFANYKQLVPCHFVALCSLYLQSVWFWVAKVSS